MVFSIFVAGEPKAQPRARRAGNRKGVYTPDTAKDWKERILIALAGKNYGITGPIECNLTFMMPRPKRLYRKNDPEGWIPHTAKPDVDNLQKAVFDAMTNAGVWKDDSQVFYTSSKKLYHSKDGQPGVWIWLRSDEEKIPV